MRAPLPPFPVALRILAAIAVAFGAAALLERALAQALIPLMWSWLDLIGPDFRTVDLLIARADVGEVLRWTVTVKRDFVVAGHVVMPDPRGLAESSVRLDHVFEACALQMALIAGWPVGGAREATWRFLWALPFLLLLVLLVAPLGLLAGIWKIVADAFDPHGTYPLLLWADFLNHGGREALGVAAAGLAIGLGALTARPASPSWKPAHRTRSDRKPGHSLG